MFLTVDIDAKAARARTIIKINKIKAFLQGNQEQKTAWDSDDDLADHEFTAGEKIDLYINTIEYKLTRVVEYIPLRTDGSLLKSMAS